MEESVDLTPYLDNRWFVRVAEKMYRSIYEPIASAIENRSVVRTRKFCEENTPK